MKTPFFQGIPDLEEKFLKISEGINFILSFSRWHTDPV